MRFAQKGKLLALSLAQELLGASALEGSMSASEGSLFDFLRLLVPKAGSRQVHLLELEIFVISGSCKPRNQ